VLGTLRLVNFRAFRDFTIAFGDGAFLVGPNNAGKSTVLMALRAADSLLKHAYRRKPSASAQHDGRHLTVYPVSLVDFPALRDSLRHEFGNEEARLELTWRSGARLVAIWPSEDRDEVDPFFYLERKQGILVRDPARVRIEYPALGVIPILGPVDHSEPLLSPAYVARSATGRLSSRHFRNQLRLLNQDEFSAFIAWADRWLDELRFDRFGQHMSDDGLILEAFFFEPGSRVPKEIVWAGDGVQVWLQLLYHVYRVMASDVIVLDEPEVYLHPDLQRRLVHLLESTSKQIVVATHSAEMIAEAEPRLVILVEKSRKHARRAKDEAVLELMSSALGTAFNLRLARALRSKVALFVEGQDMTILRRLSRILGLGALAAERGVTVIPLQGFSRWGHVEPFAWLCSEMLPQAIQTFVILDRDYRSDAEITRIESSFKTAGIAAHIWRRKELESYLLTPSVIARLSGASVPEVAAWLNASSKEMESDVFGRLLDERMRQDKSASQHAVSITSRFKTEFDSLWLDEAFRLRTCPPKQLISKINTQLQCAGHRTVSSSSLARGHRIAEVPDELATLLRDVEEVINR
jgi:AAA domain, putative AbiEii toxin, Type IV TA system/AAA ATPase domain